MVQQSKKSNAVKIASVCIIVFGIFMLSAAVVLVNFSDLSARSEMLYKIAGKTFLSDVYVLYPGNKLKRVSPTDTGIYYMPYISPVGDKVVFFGNEKGLPRIWLADLKTDQVKALTPGSSGARHPIISWDGSKVAFASDRVDESHHERIELMRGNGLPPKNVILNLFIMDIDGKNVKQITFGPYQDQRPAFSPDGKTLAFVSNRGTGLGLWTVPVDGHHDPMPIPLQTDSMAYRPVYSPDGQWIYFFAMINNRHQICRISVQGGPVIPISNDNLGTSHGPFVDYENKVLLMHSNRDGNYSIWELPLDGSPPTKINLPDFEGPAMHATRSRNGVIAFDTCRRTKIRKIASYLENIF